MKIPNNARITVLEGIAGSGKTTIKEILRGNLKGKKIYEFKEEELLLGWKHIHIPGISGLRLNFLSKFLDYIEKKLGQEKDAVFILERFHISVKILEWEFKDNFEKEYSKFLSRIKKLPVYLLIPTLNEAQIKERSAHKERDHQWNQYLKEKLKLRGFSDLESLYIAEQKQVLELAKKQGIPYSTLKVSIKNP